MDDSLYSFGITDDEAVRIKAIDGGYLLCANFTAKDDDVNGLGSKIFWCELDENYEIIRKQVISDVQIIIGKWVILSNRKMEISLL